MNVCRNFADFLEKSNAGIFCSGNLGNLEFELLQI
jgi:hypothetical protein